MQNETNAKIELLRFGNLAEFGEIRHFVSTRKGGASVAPFNGLNLALHVGDKKQSVLENRNLLAQELGIGCNDLVMMKQVHSGNPAVVEKKDRGRGARSYGDALDDADALVTNKPGLCLVVQVADCVPILLFDPVRGVVAAVHAGWRGTMAQIAKNTVEKMRQQFGCNPADIVAGIGPAIGPCCYEITDKNLLRKWEEKYQTKDNVVVARGEKKFLDLWQANKIQLMRSGVPEGSIEVMEICTGCNTDKFYSYKKEGVTGRFGAGIVLNSKFKIQNDNSKLKNKDEYYLVDNKEIRYEKVIFI